MIEARDILCDGIKDRLEAIRATAILASSGQINDPAIEGTFNALRILAEYGLEAVDELDVELSKPSQAGGQYLHLEAAK